MEALVRLRYARILFEETDNDLEAETALSKGVCIDILPWHLTGFTDLYFARLTCVIECVALIC